MLPHLEHHDVTYVAVSRAPLAQIEAFKARMGWRFPRVSSLGSDFNFDDHVSFGEADKALYNFEEEDYRSDELPGISAFCRDEAGNVCHTYSAYARDVEPMLGAYALFEFTAKGRNEQGDMHTWLRHHDRDESASQAACCVYQKENEGRA